MRRACALLAAIAAFIIPAAANAQGGVRLIVQEWNPANPTVQNNAIVLDKPGLLAAAIDQGWARAREPVCNAIKSEAGKPDRLEKGYTLYNIDCSMAKTGTLAITGFANETLTFSYTLAGNMFKATTTQPSVAGKYADPCFFLSYDVTAKAAIHLDSLAIDPFVVTISNVSRPDSCNTAGDIAHFFATTYHFFGGPDYLALVQDSLQRTQSISTTSLNTAVASVVDPIRSYSRQYANRTNWIRNGDVYIAFAPVYTPQPLTAGISGAIDIPKSDRVSSAPDCSTFTLVGNVQTGPAPIYDPIRVTVADAPFVHVGSGSAHGAASDAGNRFTCAYSATQMPAGVPVAYSGSGIGGTSANGRAPYRVWLSPEGWTGKAAFNGQASGKNFVAVPAPVVPNQAVEVNRSFVPTDVHPNESNLRLTNPIAAQQGLAALNPQPLPPGGDANLAVGNRLYGQGDFAGAAAAFGRARQSNAKNAVALHSLALAHARLGQKALALSELQQAQSLAKASGDALTANAAARSIIIVGGAAP